MNTRTFLALSTAALGAFLLPQASAAAESGPVYELRIYTTNEGKLPDLLKRFRDHTCTIFQKHGIENIGYWVPVDKDKGADNKLIYIIRHPSREAAKANWAAFQADPEWQAVAKASEANGKILAKKPDSIYMTTTAYSPEVKLGGGAEPRTYELRIYHTPDGKLDDLHARFKNHTIGIFAKHDIPSLAYWTPTDAAQGAGKTLIYIVSHPSKEAGLKNFEAFRADPDWVAAKAESEKNGPLTLPNGVESTYMQPTDFSPIK